MQTIGLKDAPPVSVGFVGFHHLFHPVWNNVTLSLTDRFALRVSEPDQHGVLDVTPDVLFCSVYEKPHLHPRYDECLKVFTCEENIRTPWDECSYAMTGDYVESPSHLRLPIYVRVLRHLRDQDCIKNHLVPDPNLTLVKDLDTDWKKIVTSKTKFCCFVNSNGSARERIRLFELLSKYKRVDSGGAVLNNLGYRVSDKLPFIASYKFTIAFENSSYPGYVSEKLVEPMIVNSMPIYWGSSQVDDDFDVRSFVCANNRRLDDVVDEVVELDRDDDKLAAKLAVPWFHGNRQNHYCETSHLADFFEKIVRRHFPDLLPPKKVCGLCRAATNQLFRTLAGSVCANCLVAEPPRGADCPTRRW